MNLTPAKTDFSPEDHAEIRRQIETIKVRDGLTQAEIGRQAEVADSTLSSYLKNRYAGDNNVPAAALHKWLKGRVRAAALRRRLPVAPTFQLLHTSQRLLDLFEMAREMGRIVSVTGVPGVSKTASARHYCQETPRAWLSTMDPSTGSVPGMLTDVLGAMGDPDRKGTPQVLTKAVVAKAIEAKGLLIIDEVQHCSDKALEQLRAINDTTRGLGRPIGIVLMGNEQTASKVGGTGTKATFAQVSSRIAQRRVLVKPDPRDVLAMSNAWADANTEVLTADMVAFLQVIAARPGGLRNVEMTFEGALLVSLAHGEPLTVEHLQGAFSQLSTIDLAA